MRKFPLAAAAIAATIVTVSGSAQEALLLRFEPPMGQVTHYRAVTQTWMHIPGMPSGDTSAPTMTQTMYTTRRVTALAGRSRIITTTVDSSRREMPGMQGMMPPGDMLRGMVTVQRIDARGKVDSVSVTPPPGADSMMAEAMKRQAGSSRGSLPMPERAVHVGDTWTDSLSLPLSAAVGSNALTTFRLTYRLEHVERAGGARIAVVSMTGAVQTDSPAAVGAAKASMNGQFRLDLEASRLISVTNDVTAVVETQAGAIPVRTHTVTEALP